MNQGKGSKSSFNDDLSIHDGEGGTSLGGELGGEALDPLANAGARRRFNGGSIVLVGVIALALVGLWFMRALSRVNAGTGGHSDLEATIEKFLKTYKGSESGDGSPSILIQQDPGTLAVLNESYTQRQVPLSDVARNPFIIWNDVIPPVTGEDGDAKRQRELTKKQGEKKSIIDRAAGTLVLKSVIMGSEPIASVSGKIVRRGDELLVNPENITFRVTEIKADSMTVVAEDEELDLVVSVEVVLKRDN